jgi:hypothetical protein
MGEKWSKHPYKCLERISNKVKEDDGDYFGKKWS